MSHPILSPEQTQALSRQIGRHPRWAMRLAARMTRVGFVGNDPLMQGHHDGVPLPAPPINIPSPAM